MNDYTISDLSTQTGPGTIPIIDEPEPPTCFCPLCLGIPDEPTPEEMAEYDAWREKLYDLTPEEIAKEKQKEEEARERTNNWMAGRYVELESQLDRFRLMRKQLDQFMADQEAKMVELLEMYRACGYADDDDS